MLMLGLFVPAKLSTPHDGYGFGDTEEDGTSEGAINLSTAYLESAADDLLTTSTRSTDTTMTSTNDDDDVLNYIDPITAEDNEEDSPKIADEILTKEMMSLSVQDRNDIQEEIHGVKCLAPTETPQLLQESLQRLEHEIKKYPILTEKVVPLSKTSYLNDIEMRLQFLRHDFFDAKKAASRMNSFVHCLLEYYGDYALERPIKLTDFTKEELKIFRKGLAQLLPFRDRSGRRIVIFFQGSESVKVETQIMIKIFLYINFVIGYKDMDAQRKGCVLIVWLVNDTIEYGGGNGTTSTSTKLRTALAVSSIPSSGISQKFMRRIQMRAKLHPACVLRASAIHICTPDTTYCRFRRSFIINAFGVNRSRLKIHLGESMELRYVLQGFGIDTDTIPISWTGTIKNGYTKQWVWIRKYIEDNNNNTTTSHTTCTATAATTCNDGSGNGNGYGNGNVSSDNDSSSCQPPPLSIIECPQLNDIIFKKGSSANSHPGNVKFKSMIQTTYERCTRIPTKSLIKEIIQEIHNQGLRILFWNEDHQWWSLFDDEKQIYKKIEYIVRDFRFSSKKSQTINRQVTTTMMTTTTTPVITQAQAQAQAQASAIPKRTTKNKLPTQRTTPMPLPLSSLSAPPSTLTPVSPHPFSSFPCNYNNNNNNIDSNNYINNNNVYNSSSNTLRLRSDTSMFLQNNGIGNHRKRLKSDATTTTIANSNNSSMMDLQQHYIDDFHDMPIFSATTEVLQVPSSSACYDGESCFGGLMDFSLE